MARISFDLNGTLLDPADRADVLDRAVELAMAHTLAGEFRPSEELLEAAGAPLPADFAPFVDVPEGLERLHGAGHDLMVLTNSATDTAERHLTRAGLRALFCEVAGTDRVRAYKPDPRVYALVESDWHVAAHWWDVLGAARAGRRTVHVARRDTLPATVHADIEVKDLSELNPRALR